MKAFIALLRVNFKSLLLATAGIGGAHKNRKKAASGVGALLLLCGLSLYLSGFYSFMMASALAPLGGLDIMLMGIMALALVFPLALTVFTSQSMIFSTKDIDLVLSLPVSSFSIMLSRVMALYLEILLMLEMLLLPAGLAWHMNGGGGAVLPLLLVMGVFLALIPTTVALVFGCLISVLISRVKHKSLFAILFSLLFIGGFMVLSFRLPSAMESIAVDIPALRSILVSTLGPLAWLTQAIVEFRPLVLLAGILACVLTFLAITWLFSLFYKQLLTHLSSHSVRSNFKLGTQSATGSFTALLAKESRKFFGTPVYVLNSGIGAIVAIGAVIFAVIKRDTIQFALAKLLGIEGGHILPELIPITLLGVTAFLVLMINPTSTTISLEGKTLWILKEAPISTGRILMAKVGFNVLLVSVTMLICIPLAGYAFSISVANTLLMLLLSLLYGFLISLMGLLINLLLPRMDAENDTIVIKQSSSVIVSMLANFLAAALMGGLYLLMRSLGLGFSLFALACAVVLAGLCACFIALLHTKGRRLFAAL